MTNWISRLARRLADLYCLPVLDSASAERDADVRRVRSELDAIRMHFPVTGERDELCRSHLTTMGGCHWTGLKKR